MCRGAVELHQAILQPLHLDGKVFALLAQETAIQLDLLQERLGSRVIVPPLVGEVLFGLVIDTHVDICHELTDRLLHLWLQELYFKEMVKAMLKIKICNFGSELHFQDLRSTS